MYGTLAISHRALDDLADTVSPTVIDQLRSMARPIEGLRVLNLSVSGFGTGTAELLNSSVPLLTDLGLDCHWQVVRASEDASHVIRAMYHALAGNYMPWTHDMTETWQRYAEMNADLLTEEFDVIIVHDPQPAAIRSFAHENPAKWLLHSHLDLTSAQDDVWLLLRSHIDRYDASIFESQSFVRPDLSLPVYIVPPAIDPNSPRNMPVADDVMRTVVEQYGIDPERPLLSQVCPCDPASNLEEAVDVWQKVREEHPELQLLIVLMTEPHDAAGRASYEELARHANEEADMFLLSMGNELGNVELNVFQRASTVIMQRGLRKGFGLWIADALWKERPCVVAPAGGLTEQVIDGETGLIARTTEEFADGICELLEKPEVAAQYARRGHDLVAEKFLITRYLGDYLRILNALHRGS